MTPTQTEVRRRLRLVASVLGFNPDWIDAIGFVESRWTEQTQVTTGTDGARGGAWGPLQITMKTACEAGFKGQETDLLDSYLSATLFYKIQSSRPGGFAQTLEDAATYWNSGRPSAVLAPEVTKDTYIPAAEKALRFAQANPVE